MSISRSIADPIAILLIRDKIPIEVEMLKMIALSIHVAAGTIAMITGAINLIGRKGGSPHRSVGKVYALSMHTVSISALILSVMIGSSFLFCLGIFTFYMTWNGQRSAKFRTVELRRSDLFVLVLGILNNIAMFLLGDPILIGLGMLSAVLITTEIRLLLQMRRNWIAPKGAWLRRHIGMIIGSYIATSTAFLVVNSSGGPWPAWLPWALPSMIGVPIIIYWSARVSKRDRSERDQRVAGSTSRSSSKMPSSL